MANNDNFDLDDFDFDDFDEFGLDDEGGFETGQKKSKKREAVETLSGSFVSGVKDKLFTRTAIERTLTDTLPVSYSNTYNSTINTARELNDIKKEATGLLSKHVNDFKKQNADSVKKLTSKLPKTIGKKYGEKINTWVDNIDNSADYKKTQQQIEALQDKALIDEVFGSLNAEQNQLQSDKAIETAANSEAQTKLTMTSNELLFGLSGGMKQLVSYQDNVSVKYQKKMLEFTYRTMLTNRKQLDVSQQLLKLQKESNESLIKNTALPDFIKAHNSEAIKHGIRQQLIGTVSDKAFKTTGELASKVTAKLGQKVNSTINDYGEMAVGSIGDVLRLVAGDDDDIDDIIPQQSTFMGGLKLSGQLAGGRLARKVLDKYTPGLADQLANNTGVQRGDLMLKNMQGRIPRMARDKLLAGNTGVGPLDSMIQWLELGDLGGKGHNVVQSSWKESLNTAAQFDLKTKRSITEVIPELLGHIHTGILKLNGEAPDGTLAFDWETNQFSTKQTINKNLINKLSRNTKTDLSATAKEVLDELDPDKDLSDETRTLIARKVSIASMTGKDVSLMNFLDPDHPDYISELQSFMEREHGDDFVSSGLSPKERFKQYTTKASDKFLRVENKILDGVRRNENNGVDPVERLRQQLITGGSDNLSNLPFVVQDTDGKWIVDYEAYYDYISNNNDGDNDSRNDVPPVPPIPGAPRGPRDYITETINKRRGGRGDFVLPDDIGPNTPPSGGTSNSKVPKHITDMFDKIQNKGASATRNVLNSGLPSTASNVSSRIMAEVLHRNTKIEMGSGFETPTSLWVKGDTSPRIEAAGIALGYYKDVDTGKTVKSIDDITGAVADKDGNIVLTKFQLLQGLFDNKGNVVKAKADVVKERIGDLKGLFKNKLNAKGLSAVLGTKITGAVPTEDIKTQLDVALVKDSAKQTNHLESIKDILKEQNSPKYKFNDRDKDGTRDGSWLDILEKRRKAKEDAKNKLLSVVPDKKDKKGKGILGMIGGFLPSIIPMLGSVIGGAFSLATPIIVKLLGGAFKVAIPMVLGSMGLKWLAKKWLNRDGGPGEGVGQPMDPSDPRLDPASPEYDARVDPNSPEYNPEVAQELGMGDKLANKVLNGGMYTAAAGGALVYGGVKYGKRGAKALGGRAIDAAARGGNRVAARMGLATRAVGPTTRQLDRALARRAASSGVARTVGRKLLATGVGTAAKVAGKTMFRTLLGPIGWAWLAYDVIKFGYDMYKKYNDDGRKLNRLRMACYGYDHNDKKHLETIFALEGELVKHIVVKAEKAELKDSITTEQIQQYFNVPADDPKAVDEWQQYFFGRFLPVFLTFATVFNKLAGSTRVFEMDEKLDPSQQLLACQRVMFTQQEETPYDIMVSGFNGEKKLELDKADVFSVYNLILKALTVRDKETRGRYTPANQAKDKESLEKREQELDQLRKDKEEKTKAKARSQSGGILGGYSADEIGNKENRMSDLEKNAAQYVDKNKQQEMGLLEKLKDFLSGGSSAGVSPGGTPTFAGAPTKGWNNNIAAAVKWGASELGIDPNYLASVISFETGGTFSPNARSPVSSATGLIQFMDAADGKKDKKYWGMSRDQFGSLSHMQQMKYVVDYFRARKLKPGASLGSIYDAVTGTGYKRGSKAYELNKVWDANKDGVISPGESVTSGAFKNHMKDFFGGANAVQTNSILGTQGGSQGLTSGASTPSTNPPPKTKAPAKAPAVAPANNAKPMAAGGVAGLVAGAKNKQAASSNGVMMNGVQGAKTASKPVKENKAKVEAGTGPLAPTGDTVDNKATINLTFPVGVGEAANKVAPGPYKNIPNDSKPAKAAAFARKAAHKNSIGMCAQYVRKALQKAGYDFTPQASAYMYHDNGTLKSAGFTQIDSGSRWQIGDVIVINRDAKHRHGHIAIWDGRNWISDFIQPSWKVYSVSPPYSMWRDTEHLNGAAPGTSWAVADAANMGGSDGTINGASGAFGTKIKAPMWQRKTKIVGGDALWGGSSKATATAEGVAPKPQSRGNVTVKAVTGGSKLWSDSGKDDDVARKTTQETKTTTAENNKAITKAEQTNTIDKQPTDSVKQASVKAAETKSQSETKRKLQERTEREAEAVRIKNETAAAKARQVKEGNDNVVSVMSKQLDIQTSMLEEIRKLRRELTTANVNKPSSSNTKPESTQAVEPEKAKDSRPPLSPVQAPTSMSSPLSMSKL